MGWFSLLSTKDSKKSSSLTFNKHKAIWGDNWILQTYLWSLIMSIFIYKLIVGHKVLQFLKNLAVHLFSLISNVKDCICKYCIWLEYKFQIFLSPTGNKKRETNFFGWFENFCASEKDVYNSRVLFTI